MRLETVEKWGYSGPFLQDFHYRVSQEGQVLRNFLASRLVGSTRNLDLELCSSSRLPALSTTALKSGEAAVCVPSCSTGVLESNSVIFLWRRPSQVGSVPSQDLAPVSLCQTRSVLGHCSFVQPHVFAVRVLLLCMSNKVAGFSKDNINSLQRRHFLSAKQ